jgi:nucleoside diphosphate kinase
MLSIKSGHFLIVLSEFMCSGPAVVMVLVGRKCYFQK